MALYRHDATGFLGEFASNPGAGYTSISAMPTDTVANRVAWWRALDTYGQTSSWHPSEYRTPQDPAEAVLSMSFSKDGAFFASDDTGAVTDGYLGGSCTVRVYRGGTDVTITEEWSLTKVDEGCTSTLTESGGVWTLTITDAPLLATQSGYVRVTATRTGSTTQVRDWNWMKVRQGRRGSGQLLVITATGIWSDAEAWAGVVAQTGEAPVLSDLVTIAKSDGSVATSKFYEGGGDGVSTFGTWTTPNSYINGSLLVTGTVAADRLAAGTITGKTIVLDGASSILKSSNYSAGSAGWAIKGDGVAEFQNVTIRGTLNASDITGGTLSVDRIAANSIAGGKITIGGISTGNIAASAITYSDVRTDYGVYEYHNTTDEYTVSSITVPASAYRGKVILVGFGSHFSDYPYSGQRATVRVYRNGVLDDTYTYDLQPASAEATMSLMYVDPSPSTSLMTYSVTYQWLYGAINARMGSLLLLELKR